MVTPDTKNKIRVLSKKLKKENIDSLSITKCNGYVKQLEYLKKILSGIGDDWVEDLEEIYEVEGSMLGLVRNDDLEEAIEQVSEQIDLIMTRLGIEEDENPKESAINSPPMNININPNFSQNQSINVSVKTQVNNLYQEFEKELGKSNPNKLKLKEIVKAIIKFLGFVF